MARAIVRAKGQVTIPEEIRRVTHLEEGDLVEVVMTSEGILLRPQKLIDATQAWFWSAEWQSGEREATADLDAGRGEKFRSGEDFLRALKVRSKRRLKR